MKNYILQQKNLFRIFSIAIIMIFALGQPAFAGRSSAGGGEVASFDVGKWALGTAIGMGSMAVGSSIGSAINGGSFADSMSSFSTLSNWSTNYSQGVALGQVNRAMGTMGQYYEWDPKATIVASSIVGGMAAGGINPGQYAYGATVGTLQGIGYGAIEGAVEGAIIASAANSKGEVSPWVGPVASLAGGFVSGSVASGNINNAALTSLSSIPSVGIQTGINYATEGMDKWDGYIIRQAASGIYPATRVISEAGVEDLTGTKIIHPSNDPFYNGHSGGVYDTGIVAPTAGTYNQPPVIEKNFEF